MTVLDKGHGYELSSLDGWFPQELWFVKRQGANYPGNYSSYPGCTIQEVLRACCDRIEYLDMQIHSWVNGCALFLLDSCINLLEWRAARRHKRFYMPKLRVHTIPARLTDGHIF